MWLYISNSVAVSYFFNLRSEIPSEPISTPRRSLSDVMMGAARSCHLPAKPTTGANGTQTSMDRLQGDLIDWLESAGLKFPHDLCDSEGVYIVRSLARALWMIDGNHSTLQAAVKHNSVPPLPPVWQRFDGYNDWRAKKLHKPRSSTEKMRDSGNLLLGMLGKPVIRTARWKEFREQVEGLARTLLKYSQYLSEAAKASTSRQSLDHVVRPVSQFSDLEVRSAADSDTAWCVSDRELRLEETLQSAGDWMMVEFDGSAILGDSASVNTRYQFLKSFKLTFPVLMYTYAAGGNVGNIIFMCKIPDGLSPSECLTKSNAVVAELKPKLPEYHTRQMRRSFSQQCSNLTDVTPATRRFMYSLLTGDDSAPETSQQRDLDFRVRLVVLGQLPELAADLRHLNGGRPGVYDEFLSVVQAITREFMAEDERRHGAAHFSHFISVRDLHRLAVDKCAESTSIPSLEWLRLQFQPQSCRAKSALHYTGKLDIRYAVQVRQLRAAHCDDHYCAALFKMERAMCVAYRSFSTFVCLDDKAKVPIGEPSSPMSTGVRGGAILMAAGSTPVALDHDQASKGSLTPSVVLQCEIPDSPTGSFYRGQLHVLIKDSVLQPSTPLRHGTELTRLLQEAPTPLLLAFTDGGGDHRSTFLSVQLSWILLFLRLDLDMLVTCRTAPGHSYVNPAERCMSTLNLALQNCALSRDAQDRNVEKRLKACNTMEAIRKQQPVIRDGWSASVKNTQKAVERRFNRLMYSDQQVLVHEPASADDITDFLQQAKDVDSTIDCEDVAPRQLDLKSKEQLALFLSTHCRQCHYSFQIKKCGEQ